MGLEKAEHRLAGVQKMTASRVEGLEMMYDNGKKQNWGTSHNFPPPLGGSSRCLLMASRVLTVHQARPGCVTGTKEATQVAVA